MYGQPSGIVVLPVTDISLIGVAHFLHAAEYNVGPMEKWVATTGPNLGFEVRYKTNLTYWLWELSPHFRYRNKFTLVS